MTEVKDNIKMDLIYLYSVTSIHHHILRRSVILNISQEFANYAVHSNICSFIYPGTNIFFNTLFPNVLHLRFSFKIKNTIYSRYFKLSGQFHFVLEFGAFYLYIITKIYFMFGISFPGCKTNKCT